MGPTSFRAEYAQEDAQSLAHLPGELILWEPSTGCEEDSDGQPRNREPWEKSGAKKKSVKEGRRARVSLLLDNKAYF